jgi:hypothetical protein
MTSDQQQRCQDNQERWPSLGGAGPSRVMASQEGVGCRRHGPRLPSPHRPASSQPRPMVRGRKAPTHKGQRPAVRAVARELQEDDLWLPAADSGEPTRPGDSPDRRPVGAPTTSSVPAAQPDQLPNPTSVVLLVDRGRRVAVSRSRSPRRRLRGPDRMGRVGARGSDPQHTRVRCPCRSHSHSPRPQGQGTRRDRTDHTVLGWSSAASARLMVAVAVALAVSWRPPS